MTKANNNSGKAIIIALGILVTLQLIIIGGLVAFIVGNDNFIGNSQVDQTNERENISTQEQNTADNVTEDRDGRNIETSTEPPEKDMKTYSNENYPDFAVEYDANIWDMEVESNETFMEQVNPSELILTNDHGKLHYIFDLNLGSETACGDKAYAKVGDHYRITDPFDGGTYVEKHSPERFNYHYYDELTERGSEDWQEIVNAWKEPDYSDTDYCYAPGFPFSTKTTYQGDGVGFPKGKDIDATIYVMYVPNDKDNIYGLDQADQVVRNFEF